MNLTIHKQIVDLLEEADTRGLTLNVWDSPTSAGYGLTHVNRRNSQQASAILTSVPLNCF